MTPALWFAFVAATVLVVNFADFIGGWIADIIQERHDGR